MTLTVNVNVGHDDDPDDMKGLTHILEHLLPPLNQDDDMEYFDASGGSKDANAARGRTFYKFSIPVSLENEFFILKLARDKIFFLDLDPKQFEMEKAVLLTERGMDTDSCGDIYSRLTSFAR